MTDTVNIVKLCVGVETVDDLIDWHESQRARWPAGCTIHVTRMRPKREADLTNGGSLYWVIKGEILARQRIVRLEERRGEDGILRCALVLDAKLIRTESAPRRPFQGWRYLPPETSPRDLPEGRDREEALPPELAAAMARFGLR